MDLYGPIATAAQVPFVVAQLGQSLDGFIATRSGASHYVTGLESLVHLHRLRALCDAVIVGWRTVAADNPQLTVRRVEGKSPMRVVVDAKGQLSPAMRVFANDAPGAIRVTAPGAADLPGVQSIRLAEEMGRIDPVAIVDALAAQGHKRILVEGGGGLVTSFLAAGVLDRLHLAIAPILIGEGRRGLSLPAVESLDDAHRPPSRHFAMGNDVLFDLDLGGGMKR
jgi:riboflavin-specific deaminase-like protein